MSAKVTAALEEGLICCGLMRGITFSVRSITKMITREEDDHQDRLPAVCEVLDFLAQRGVATAGGGEGVGGRRPHGGGDAGVAAAAWTPGARAAPLTLAAVAPRAAAACLAAATASASAPA